MCLSVPAGVMLRAAGCGSSTDRDNLEASGARPAQADLGSYSTSRPLRSEVNLQQANRWRLRQGGCRIAGTPIVPTACFSANTALATGHASSLFVYWDGPCCFGSHLLTFGASCLLGRRSQTLPQTVLTYGVQDTRTYIIHDQSIIVLVTLFFYVYT